MYQFGRDLIPTRTYPPIYTQIHKTKNIDYTRKNIDYTRKNIDHTPTFPEEWDDTPKNVDDTSTFPEEWQDTHTSEEWDNTTATEQTLDTTNDSIHTSPHTLEQMKKWIKIMFIEHPEDEQIDSLSRGIDKYANNSIIHLKHLLKGMPVMYGGRRSTIESLEMDGIVVLWMVEPEKIERVHFNEIEF